MLAGSCTPNFPGLSNGWMSYRTSRRARPSGSCLEVFHVTLSCARAIASGGATLNELGLLLIIYILRVGCGEGACDSSRSPSPSLLPASSNTQIAGHHLSFCMPPRQTAASNTYWPETITPAMSHRHSSKGRPRALSNATNPQSEREMNSNWPHPSWVSKPKQECVAFCSQIGGRFLLTFAQIERPAVVRVVQQKLRSAASVETTLSVRTTRIGERAEQELAAPSTTRRPSKEHWYAMLFFKMSVSS